MSVKYLIKREVMRFTNTWADGIAEASTIERLLNNLATAEHQNTFFV